MALQVWLPLNGKMGNCGVAGDGITVTGTPVFVNGIMGKALNTGGATMSAEMTGKVLNNKAFSYCCWFYVNAETGSSDRTMIFGNDGGLSSRKFAIFQYPTCNDLHLSWGNDDGTTFIVPILSGVLPSKKWTHIAVVYDNPTVKVYINGKVQWTGSGVSDSSSFAYMTNLIHNSSYHYMNDIRIYDNALSPKEVHEIAQGLCCHYPLNMVDGKNFGRNLIKNSTLANKRPDEAGSEQMNSITSVTYDGEACHLITPGDAGNVNNGISFTWNDFTTLGLAKGDTITFSFDVKGTSDSNKPNTNIMIQNTATTWYTSGHLESSRVCFVPTDEYKRVSLTYTIPTDAAFTSKKIWLAIHGNMQSDLYIKNLKLEKGSSATYWTPAVEDYPGLYDDVVYDTSGFGNHGSVAAASAPILAGDSARYDRCYEFDGTNDYITVKNPFNSSMTEFSISCWANISYGTTQTLYTARTSVGNGIALFVYNNSLRLDDNTQTCFSYDMTSYNNKWTHICLTRNAAQKKLYVNGTLVAAVASTSDMGNIGVNGTIGGSESQDDGVGVGNWLKGKLSDFRLYATALSDDDVAALYKSPISVTNNGAMIVKGEVIESI